MGKVKSNTDERRIKYCTICKKKHPITEDGFEYLDCMLYVKKRDGKKSLDDGNHHYVDSVKIFIKL